MKIAVLFGSESFENDEKWQELKRNVLKGNNFEFTRVNDNPGPGFDMLLSVGGDGTYLTAAAVAAKADIPILGLNLGRIGFLSENEPEDVYNALINNSFHIEEMPLLSIKAEGKTYTALNELTVSRNTGSPIGIDVVINENALPTYWADGLLVSTPAGSTAYSLSVGGPIVLPSSKVLILSPIAPHNLNVRPLVVSQDSKIKMSFNVRGDKVRLSADNTSFCVDANSTVDVSTADYTLKRVCLPKSNFIKALSEKLFWGKDKRNERQY